LSPSITIVPAPLDREVVHADHLDAVLDEVRGARPGHADVVGVELGVAPQPRVRGLEQHADIVRQIDRFEVLRGDAGARVDLDDPGAPDQQLQRQRLGPRAIVEKVAGRVDVGAGVGAEVEGRDVGAGAVGDALVRFD